ncbi:hypothetical protein CEXT_199791 [Caerostris extrusa]|uniref:Uncharacterized protein n=1 Tax=Caerostris extrusa TaxID=172846 RepID=A0AAV4QES9_CAEEX|nr:hypothetical protein CEXT_199791 [Caerostris extrusa]
MSSEKNSSSELFLACERTFRFSGVTRDPLRQLKCIKIENITAYFCQEDNDDVIEALYSVLTSLFSLMFDKWAISKKTIPVKLRLFIGVFHRQIGHLNQFVDSLPQVRTRETSPGGRRASAFLGQSDGLSGVKLRAVTEGEIENCKSRD